MALSAKARRDCQTRRVVRGAMALIVSGGLSAAAIAGENWTRFRGPNGSGVAAASFPAEWTADDYDWKVTLPGKGHSSPVGWEGLAFVTYGDEETGDLTLAAIGVDDGETRWIRRFRGTSDSIHAANSYASGTPTVDSRRVYISWTANDKLHAAAVDHRGKIAWERELGPAEYKHGSGNSPILLDDLLIVANDHTGESFIVGLDVASGDERWRLSRDGGVESYATPLVVAGGDGAEQIVVCSSAEGIAGISPEDGAVLWQRAGIYPARCVNSPVLAAGLVFTGSGEGGNGKSLTAVRLTNGDQGEPSIEFELKKSLAQVPTPIAVGDLLFVWSDRGVVSCYRAADGKEVWTKRIGGNYFSSPIVADKKMYAVAADGEAVCIAARDRFELLGRSQLGEGSHATPAVHQGKMLLRTESSLACLPAK